MSEGRIRAVERLFGIWLELSRDEELLALLALLQRDLRRRGYSISVELARDVERRPGGEETP